MELYHNLVARKEKLALVGLGYVGMPIAVEFAKHVPVIVLRLSMELLVDVSCIPQI